FFFCSSVTFSSSCTLLLVNSEAGPPKPPIGRPWARTGAVTKASKARLRETRHRLRIVTVLVRVMKPGFSTSRLHSVRRSRRGYNHETPSAGGCVAPAHFFGAAPMRIPHAVPVLLAFLAPLAPAAEPKPITVDEKAIDAVLAKALKDFDAPGLACAI